MRFARIVLLASAALFAAVGLAFLIAPHELAASVGIALVNATAENDARAVYGGLQLGCAALLAAAARSDALVRAGIAAQIMLFGALAGARFVSLAAAGAPGSLGLSLHATELAASAAGVIAWRLLRRPAAASSHPAPSPGFAIRCARPAELEPLLPLVTAFQREEGYPADEPSLRRALAELLADERAGRVLMLLEGERVRGYALLCLGFSLEHRGRDAFVDEIYVAEALRGRGHGRALLRALEAEARALGVRTLHLEVERRNEGARRLYAGEGFASRDRELLDKRLG